MVQVLGNMETCANFRLWYRCAFFLSILTAGMLIPGLSGAEPPEIQYEWGHRQVADMTVDPLVPEGSVFLTFHANQNVVPVDIDSGLEEISPSTWRSNRPWDSLEPFTQGFVNDLAETTQVMVRYSPRMALDPLRHEIPAINLITEPRNLWAPDSGLYVFGLNENCHQRGEEWERYTIMQYFDGSNSPEFVEPIGLRINGNWSRNLDRKGLRFYFDDYGASDSIEYDFFDSSPLSFQRLVVRSGRGPHRNINSIFVEEMFREQGHLASRHQHVVTYLNGEYWSFQTMRERIDSEFIEHTHNLDGDGYSLVKDGVTEEGNGDTFWAFLNSCLEDQDFSSHQWFEHCNDNIEINSYLDWLLINIFGATADNGGTGNLILLRLGEGPWIFVMHDEDDVFKLDNLENDHFHFMSINSQEEFDQYRPVALFSGSAESRILMASPFRGLMQNSEFRILFKNRVEELLQGPLSEAELQDRLENIKLIQGPEMVHHLARWDEWNGLYTWYCDNLWTWLVQRRVHFINHFNDFLELYRSPVELTHFTGSAVADGQIHLSWETQSEENQLGFNIYEGSTPEDLDLVFSFEEHSSLASQGSIWSPSDYFFVDDSMEDEFPRYYQLGSVNQQGQETLLPWTIEILNPYMPALVINEFMALNNHGLVDETGTPEDWVELFNHGSEAIDLEGMFLTDELEEPEKWEFPAEIIEPGQHLIIWCDSDPEDGPLHADFKLSASGEALGLFTSEDDGIQLIDSRVFGIQHLDISEGRSPDGSDVWIQFIIPSPGQPNGFPTPVPDLMSSSLSLEPNHPNPFNPSTTIDFSLAQACQLELVIFDLNGRRVRTLVGNERYEGGRHSLTWNGKNDSGQMLSSGTYFCRAQTETMVQTIKLTLVK